MGIVLSAENVSIRYITGDFKDIGLKEYVVRRLTNNYHVKEFMAVDGVSFELEEGDMLGIIGSNGAGKSTLLKAVAGIMVPTQGKITANGDIAALLELGSGFDGDLTVRENAYLRGAMLGYTREFMDETYDQIIDFAELKEFEDRPFKQLSSGMKSRLAFSIASLVKPDILILDEVLSVGDGAFQEKSAKKMREIISQGATTILVSHSLNQIRELCNKVLWLDHGRQVAFGETEEICDRYEAFLSHGGGGGSSLDTQTEAGKAETAKRRTDEAETSVRESPRHARRFACSLDLEKILKLSLPLLYIIFLVFLFIEESYIGGNEEILIVPRPESGSVTFRGAMVDGDWFDPQGIVVNLAEGGWTLDETENTLTATNNQSLQLNLPFGKERSLVFNIGPEEGIVEIHGAQNNQEIDLHREESNDYGEAFSLPCVRFIDPLKRELASFAFIVLLILAMAACNIHCRRAHRGQGLIKAGRNGAIELLRFYIALCVLVHHYCGLTPGGYLGVDFFFILSGYLLMQYYKTREKGNMPAAMAAACYTKQRYLRLIPMYLFAFFLSIGLFVCHFDGGLPGAMLTDNFWELTMLESFGFTENLAVGPGWYCSALLIAGFCVYFLLNRYKETYLYVIAPLSLLLIFVWTRQSIGHLNRWLQFDSFISTGTLRGFAEMGLGCICFEIVSKLCDRKLRSRWPSTMLELLCFSYMNYVIWKAAPSDKDFVAVFAMAALITSLFMGGSLWSKLFQNRLSQYLGSISMGIFLTHTILLRIDWANLGARIGLSWATSSVIYLLFVLALSTVSTQFVENILWQLRQASYVQRAEASYSNHQNT